MMPPFCISTEATGVGDYGTQAGPLDVPRHRDGWRKRCSLRTSTSRSRRAWMSITAPFSRCRRCSVTRHGLPVIPIFINSVATPLGPCVVSRALGTAVGNYLATLDKRVLVIGSGGLSHDPPVPTLATAPPAALGRIVGRRADVARAASGASGRGDGGRAQLRPRRQQAAAPQPRNGTIASWKSLTAAISPTSTTGPPPGWRTRRATRPTRCARGWPRSPRSRRRVRTGPRTGSTAPRPS